MKNDLGWMERARCRIAADWTSSVTRFRPDTATRIQLSAICAACPVRRDCAAYAVRMRVENGMYAGVWVPAHGVIPRQPTKQWRAAQRILRAIARAPISGRTR